jgi:hypothetical protein
MNFTIVTVLLLSCVLVCECDTPDFSGKQHTIELLPQDSHIFIVKGNNQNVAVSVLSHSKDSQDLKWWDIYACVIVNNTNSNIQYSSYLVTFSFNRAHTNEIIFHNPHNHSLMLFYSFTYEYGILYRSCLFIWNTMCIIAVFVLTNSILHFLVLTICFTILSLYCVATSERNELFEISTNKKIESLQKEQKEIKKQISEILILLKSHE